MTTDHQKICLVTGANSGIGKAIAIGLAKSGAHVIMVCRDLTKGDAALAEIKTLTGSTQVDLLIADLSSQAEIRKLAKIIYTDYPKLNVLINNVGIILTQKSLSVDGIEMTLATNYLGPFLLTNLLIDLLKKNSPARVINISSEAHQLAKLDLHDLQYEYRQYQFMRVYAQSKLLMNLATFELARKLHGQGIAVNCVHPGVVRTALGDNRINSSVLRWLGKIIKLFFINPTTSAKPIVDLAISPEFETITGKYFVKGRPAPASIMTDEPGLAEKVWVMSEKLVSH